MPRLDRVESNSIVLSVLAEDTVLYHCMPLAPKKTLHVPFAVWTCVLHVLWPIWGHCLMSLAACLFCLCSEGAASPCSISHHHPKGSIWKKQCCRATLKELELSSTNYHRDDFQNSSPFFSHQKCECSIRSLCLSVCLFGQMLPNLNYPKNDTLIRHSHI